jgi:hypothetical protein
MSRSCTEQGAELNPVVRLASVNRDFVGKVCYSGGKQRGEIQLKVSQRWEKFLLPKWEEVHWTWQRVFLLAVAVLIFADSLIVPYSTNLDPGRSGAGILFLILGFRAVSRNELPTSVVVTGASLAALVSCMNHGLVRSPSLIWTPLGILLLALVLFWGRRKRKPKTAGEIAGIIERFLNGNRLYPQEWNDFVECSHPDKLLDSFRKRCDLLDPLVNSPEPEDPKALEELRNMVRELRRLSTPG